MAGYRVGLKLWGLLEEFWSRQEVVTRQNGFCGLHLQATRGTTQVGVALPTIFNVEVEIVVQYWISLTLKEKSYVCDGLRVVMGRIMGMFYADNGLIGLRDPYWL